MARSEAIEAFLETGFAPRNWDAWGGDVLRAEAGAFLIQCGQVIECEGALHAALVLAARHDGRQRLGRGGGELHVGGVGLALYSLPALVLALLAAVRTS